MSKAGKGRRLENKTKKLLERAGYMVIRSAASKGPFDLAAFSPGSSIRLIQVKSNGKPRQAEEEALQTYSGLYKSISIEVWIWKDRAPDPLIRRY